jgi:hypothetical protein
MYKALQPARQYQHDAYFRATPSFLLQVRRRRAHVLKSNPKNWRFARPRPMAGTRRHHVIFKRRLFDRHPIFRLLLRFPPRLSAYFCFGHLHMICVGAAYTLHLHIISVAVTSVVYLEATPVIDFAKSDKDAFGTLLSSFPEERWTSPDRA